MAEVAQNVPKPEVQRVRGPAIVVFRAYKDGLSHPEALRQVDEAKLVMVSSKRMDKALVGSDEWRGISEVFPAWMGTITGHEAPGKVFGAEMVYTDPSTGQRYVFPTGDAKGSKNVILVAEHPDYVLMPQKSETTGGTDLIVQASAVTKLENFPTSDDWYAADAVHGIPIGRSVNSDRADARYLWRLGEARVGAVLRVCGCRRYVLLNLGPSSRIGVAVEAPEGGASKIVAGIQSVVFDDSKTSPQLRCGSVPNGTEASKLRITQEGQRLIVEGTPEQLTAAIALLGTL